MSTTENLLPARGVAQASPASDEVLYSKVMWKLIPLLITCYALAYLDRVNVGFAKLQMLSDLGFSEAVYGFGAGIFFLGYFLFEVPSNLILHRVGARRWIARIMITWGLLATAMMFVKTPTAFYVVRFLLGVAEAGFFPGIVLYMSYWMPPSRMAKSLAVLFMAVPLSGVIGGPLSGWVMQSFDRLGDLRGWQWMFLIEGLPSVLMGFVVLYKLRDGIADAAWLSTEEKKILTDNLKRESGKQIGHSVMDAFRLPIVWVMCLIEFCIGLGLYGMGFWMPTLLREAGVTGLLNIGLVGAIPYGAAAICMVIVGRLADRRRDRKTYLSVATMVGAIALGLSMSYPQNTLFAIGALTVATAAILTGFAQFWVLPQLVLSDRAAAAGIALITAIANISGFLSPYAIGLLRETTKSGAAGMWITAGSLAVASLVTLTLPGKLVNR